MARIHHQTFCFLPEVDLAGGFVWRSDSATLDVAEHRNLRAIRGTVTRWRYSRARPCVSSVSLQIFFFIALLLRAQRCRTRNPPWGEDKPEVETSLNVARADFKKNCWEWQQLLFFLVLINTYGFLAIFVGFASARPGPRKKHALCLARTQAYAAMYATALLRINMVLSRYAWQSQRYFSTTCRSERALSAATSSRMVTCFYCWHSSASQ